VGYLSLSASFDVPRLRQRPLNKKPILRISPSDLDNLLSTLDVRFVALSECLVSRGHGLEIEAASVPGIHYNVLGTGKMYIGDGAPVQLSPHTLVVVPAKLSCRIEVPTTTGESVKPMALDSRAQIATKDGVGRFSGGNGTPELTLICGFFSALYGNTTDLFCTLSAPIVEQFAPEDQLDVKFKQALSELVAQEVGSRTMSSALLKQILVALLRRSLISLDVWVERFSAISDLQIARALADMVSNPGAAHTTRSLAQSACLSRSAFMSRFVSMMGRPPMVVLRELRMRRAAQHLKTLSLSVGQVARNVGYASRSSFVRAFRRVYGRDPSAYRDAMVNVRPNKESAAGTDNAP
jgi:AraC family transcriptional activator of mtrCDE